MLACADPAEDTALSSDQRDSLVHSHQMLNRLAFMLPTRASEPFSSESSKSGI
jgi:hypothetical protein